MSAKLAYFNKKLDATDYWKKENSASNLYLFQMDRENAKKGTKQFVVGSLDEVWKLLKSGRNNIYESWEDRPIHFALDIDYPTNKITYTELLLHVQQIITGIIIVVNSLDYQMKVENIVVLENENQEKNKEKLKKYSFHIIFRGLVMENCFAACKFFESLEGINLEGCDNSIYRKTCFRTCFSTKLGQDQLLVPKVIN